jgi:STE24 endopeptidase
MAPAIAFAAAAAARPRGGIRSPAAVPGVVLALVALELALLPAVNAVSRRYEAEADWRALQATREPGAAAQMFRRFVSANLADPTPPPWARVLLGTHPTLVERVAMTTRAPRGGS